MTKKLFNAIESESEEWDALVDDNFTIIGGEAIPMATYASLAAIQAAQPANQNDDGLATITDATAGKILVLSNGTVYRLIPVQASAIVTLTDNSTGTSDGDTIAAVTTFPTAADAIATLAAKVNALLAVMRTAGQLVP